MLFVRVKLMVGRASNKSTALSWHLAIASCKAVSPSTSWKY